LIEAILAVGGGVVVGIGLVFLVTRLTEQEQV